jgi:hypothetical protein
MQELTTQVDMDFAFLTSGPTLRVTIPATLPTVPELSSPILSGIGAREWVFEPPIWGQRLSEGMDRDGELLEVLSDRNGNQVNLYRRLDLPLTWWLKWQLEIGVLATHIREEDTLDSVDLILQKVSIVQEEAIPFLLLDAPLRRVVHSFPGYQEFASTWYQEGEIALRFVRPSFLPPGKVVSNETPTGVTLRTGTQFGVEIQVTETGIRRAEALLDQVVASLRERSSTAS